MSIRDVRHQHSVLSSKVQSATVGASPTLRESASLKAAPESPAASPGLPTRRSSLAERAGAGSPLKLHPTPGRVTTIGTTVPSLFSVHSDSKRATRSVISRMDDVGKIWAKNEKQKRQNKSLKRKGVRQICQYQRELTKLNRFVDDQMMQIRKNVQQDKIERDRLRLAYEVATGAKDAADTRLGQAGTRDAHDRLLSMPVPNPTVDQADIADELLVAEVEV